GRFELKPEGWREYVGGISMSEGEYRVFQELKGKIQGVPRPISFPHPVRLFCHHGPAGIANKKKCISDPTYNRKCNLNNSYDF
ncbi:MAG TPA: hypothetical protein VE912_09585, partial [Bacteroidales bacterium]|nr:hypothetical protein [Bacteroidales bacterium]